MVETDDFRFMKSSTPSSNARSSSAELTPSLRTTTGMDLVKGNLLRDSIRYIVSRPLVCMFMIISSNRHRDATCMVSLMVVASISLKPFKKSARTSTLFLSSSTISIFLGCIKTPRLYTRNLLIIQNILSDLGFACFELRQDKIQTRYLFFYLLSVFLFYYYLNAPTPEHYQKLYKKVFLILLHNCNNIFKILQIM